MSPRRAAGCFVDLSFESASNGTCTDQSIAVSISLDDVLPEHAHNVKTSHCDKRHNSQLRGKQYPQKPEQHAKGEYRKKENGGWHINSALLDHRLKEVALKLLNYQKQQ